jgi:uncharacterized protein
MFHTIITLSYTIPGIYLFIRIWQLFIEKKHRFRYVIIFGIFFLIYPVTNLLNPGTGIVETVSNYLLPVFLYLFLGVLLTDILLLINLLLKILPSEKVHHWTFRRRWFMMIILCALGVVIAGIINFNTIRISEYSINVPRRSSDLNHLKIAFVSDFHLDKQVPAGFVRRYVKKIMRINPDLLLYGGDILEGSGENIPEYEKMLGTIKPAFGVYGVLGNHDRIGRSSKVNFFSRAGIILLRDSIITKDRAFVLVGRLDNRNGRESASELVSSAAFNLPLIILDHRPTETDQISRTNADIVFSGHTHNGQLFPINLYLHRVYEISHGYLKKANTHFFVSSGIRLWGPPVRTTGKSEIVVVNVSFSE